MYGHGTYLVGSLINYIIFLSTVFFWVDLSILMISRILVLYYVYDMFMLIGSVGAAMT